MKSIKCRLGFHDYEWVESYLICKRKDCDFKRWSSRVAQTQLAVDILTAILNYAITEVERKEKEA